MEKYIAICIACIAVLGGGFLLFTHCRDEGIHMLHWYEISSPLSFNPELENVELNVISINSDEVRAELVNNTEHDIVTGCCFDFEFFDGNDWRIIPYRNFRPIPGIITESNSTRLEHFNIGGDFFPFPDVELYRVRRSYVIRPREPMYIGDVLRHDLVIEFSLN
ncbi:MAG: hypothetical protein FWC89_05595 [Defluviitaleaceae bacterium]|nr:hypothetical protein [Defluviitaleaceae bacterium]